MEAGLEQKYNFDVVRWFTIMAVVYLVVGAFVGDECRGIARPLYVDGVWRHEVFLMVCGNEATGEKVTLQAFDADAGARRWLVRHILSILL